MSKTTASPLKTATDILGSQKIVAIVGNPGSGKTVVGTLLKDAIFTHFSPQHRDEFSTNLIKGSDVLEEVEQCLFTDNIFPPETTPGTKSELIFEIVRTQALGDKIHFKIRDISGEDYRLAFQGDEVSAESRVNNVLAEDKEKAVYGPLSYLIFAKIYAILIDCSEFSNWKTIETRQSQMLNSILDFKKVLGETDDKGKFSTPLAIILTKIDTLEGGIETSPEHMIEKYMPQFFQTLLHVHSGKRKFFSVYIEGEKLDTQNMPKPEEKNLVTTPDAKSDTGELIEEEKPTEVKKLKTPIAYNSGEYVKFILWVIETLA